MATFGHFGTLFNGLKSRIAKTKSDETGFFRKKGGFCIFCKNAKTYIIGIQSGVLKHLKLMCTGVPKVTHFGQKRGFKTEGEKGRFFFNQKYPFLGYF